MLYILQYKAGHCHLVFMVKGIEWFLWSKELHGKPYLGLQIPTICQVFKMLKTL